MNENTVLHELLKSLDTLLSAKYAQLLDDIDEVEKNRIKSKLLLIKGVKVYSIRENLEDIIKEQLGQFINNENIIGNNEEQIKKTKSMIEELSDLLNTDNSTEIDLGQAADKAIELCTACYDLLTVFREGSNKKEK